MAEQGSEDWPVNQESSELQRFPNRVNVRPRRRNPSRRHNEPRRWGPGENHLYAENYHPENEVPENGTASESDASGSERGPGQRLHPGLAADDHNQAEKNSREMQLPAINMEGIRELKVVPGSNPKAVAGSIAKSIRERVLPVVMAIGDASVNQSVKAFAYARSFLEDDDVDVCFQPELAQDRQSRFVVHLHAYEAHRRTEAQRAAVARVQQEMKVAATSSPASVAGAIANRARVGERICVMAIGPTSVSNAIRAIALARRYLCHDSLEVFCKPELCLVDVDQGEQRCSLAFDLLVVQI